MSRAVYALAYAGLSGLFGGCSWMFAGRADQFSALVTGITCGSLLVLAVGYGLAALDTHMRRRSS